MRELFVYYRVEAHATAAAQVSVLAMQAQLRRAHPALVARLLCREGESDAPDSGPTWMETYAMNSGRVDVDIDLALQAVIESAAEALGPGLIGPRHTEVFFACAS
jgi:Domain of unknown function (DUF4936)